MSDSEAQDFQSEYWFLGRFPVLNSSVPCVCVDASSVWAIWLSDGRSTGSLKITMSAQSLSTGPTDVLFVATLLLLLFLDKQSVDWKHKRPYVTDEQMSAAVCSAAEVSFSDCVSVIIRW